MTPTAFFQDSPAWAADPVMAASLKTCVTRPGLAIDPVYLASLQVAARADAGIKAYEARRYEEALTHLSAARTFPAGDQVRILNGLYLTHQALGLEPEAEQAFGQVVDVGLSREKLAVEFVFRPASTEFWPDRSVSGNYPMWLRQIAQRTAAREECLRLVGHTSPTGDPAMNDALSERRAVSVQAQLIGRVPPLAHRTQARGVGSREVIIGNGRDDLTDVLDRRVEFAPLRCETLRADAGPAARIN